MQAQPYALNEAGLYDSFDRRLRNVDLQLTNVLERSLQRKAEALELPASSVLRNTGANDVGRVARAQAAASSAAPQSSSSSRGFDALAEYSALVMDACGGDPACRTPNTLHHDRYHNRYSDYPPRAASQPLPPRIPKQSTQQAYDDFLKELESKTSIPLAGYL
eukprot:TRINITY_DN3381_c0_g1_i3.p1 TRINITY_DN3381_c0_g1~~TRINITY_DN3381_c0_g1_i3.p1  ORF type:complete len:173 (-),score=56.18 TRINITY_DN3381_c0_g1_i3:183-671(-)